VATVREVALMAGVTPVNSDSLGWPGKVGKPKGVDPATTELWRSLGIHVPPSVRMRLARAAKGQGTA
jgi:hypothetical protein